MKQEQVNAMLSGAQNSSNPFANYIQLIETYQRREEARANSGVPPNTSSVSPADTSLDLASALKEYELYKTLEEKFALKARLQPIIISRLEKLSGMEQTTNVGVQIADAVDFLTLLNPSDPRFVEIGKISHTSREGVISLQRGKLQLKEAQDKLYSQLRSLSPHHIEDV